MGVVVSDMSSVIPRGESRSVGQYGGQPGNTGVFRKSAVRRGASITTSIANGELCKRDRPDRFDRQSVRSRESAGA